MLKQNDYVIADSVDVFSGECELTDGQPESILMMQIGSSGIKFNVIMRQQQAESVIDLLLKSLSRERERNGDT